MGAIDLFDDDKICLTNLNRQIIATRQTIGRDKIEVMAERLKSIDPTVEVGCYNVFYLPETADQFDLSKYDYIIDAVDTVSAKLELIVRAKALDVPIISAMGAGNKLDPTRLHVADVYDTKVCPLARVMRRELKRRGVKRCKVVYSDETPVRPMEDEENSCAYHCVCPPGTKRKCTVRRDIPGSTSFVPPVMGMIIAGEIVMELSGIQTR